MLVFICLHNVFFFVPAVREWVDARGEEHVDTEVLETVIVEGGEGDH